MRGRPRNKGPNPLTRSYESNGPDVKIRGTAQHIADKYAQLARDATASGDPVSAENYHQHAEHYYRLIAAAQEQYRQQFGAPQRPFDEDGEEGDEEGAQPNGFGYPGERPANGMDEFGEGGPAGPPQAYEGRQGGNQGRFDRQDRGQDRQRFDRGGERFDRNARGDGRDRFQGGDGRDRFQGGDRGGEGRERFGGGERGPEGRERFQGGERGERQGGGERGQAERFDRGQGERQAGPERGAGDRFDRGQGGGERPNGYGPNGERYDRQDGGRERFGRGDGGREGRPDTGRRDREFNRADRPAREPRPGAPTDEAREPVPGNLPAFLTNPVRTPITVAEPEPVETAPAAHEPEAELNGAAEPRARRTRRPRRQDSPEALDFGAAPETEKPAE